MSPTQYPALGRIPPPRYGGSSAPANQVGQPEAMAGFPVTAVLAAFQRPRRLYFRKAGLLGSRPGGKRHKVE